MKNHPEISKNRFIWSPIGRDVQYLENFLENRVFGVVGLEPVNLDDGLTMLAKIVSSHPMN